VNADTHARTRLVDSPSTQCLLSINPRRRRRRWRLSLGRVLVLNDLPASPLKCPSLHLPVNQKVHACRWRPLLQDVATQVDFESKFEGGSSRFSSRRFKHEFHRINLHRPTKMNSKGEICREFTTAMMATAKQGLVHISAHRKHRLWDTLGSFSV